MAYLIYQKTKSRPVSDRFVGRVVSEVLRSARATQADLSVHLIGDQLMRRLNRTYRSKDKTTDVLSFGTSERDDLGDIFICLPQIKRQAKRFAVSEKEEFTRILIHGVLHLLGFDHEKPNEAKVMFAKQEKLLKKFL